VTEEEGRRGRLCVCVRAGDSFIMRRWVAPFGLVMKRQKKVGWIKKMLLLSQKHRLQF